MSEPIVLCKFKDCTKPASHNYRWDWGEEGTTCAECIPLMKQTAENLGRGVTFSPIEAVATETPLTRSERTRLIAEKLSAESERDEVIARGRTLYESNVDLTQQVQRHVMREREQTAQIEAASESIKVLQLALEQREKQLAESNAEVQRLQVLVPFVGEPTTPADRGLASGD